jgi:hypothetical protein
LLRSLLYHTVVLYPTPSPLRTPSHTPFHHELSTLPVKARHPSRPSPSFTTSPLSTSGCRSPSTGATQVRGTWAVTPHVLYPQQWLLASSEGTRHNGLVLVRISRTPAVFFKMLGGIR